MEEAAIIRKPLLDENLARAFPVHEEQVQYISVWNKWDDDLRYRCYSLDLRAAHPKTIISIAE
jgi:hypothetical protein